MIFGIEKNEGNEDDVDTSQNDILKSTIEDYLEVFKDKINGDGYEKLVGALFEYFNAVWLFPSFILTFPIIVKINDFFDFESE